MNRVELGRHYHCRRLGVEGLQTGVFCRSADKMTVHLFDYEEFFHIEDGAELHLQLEDTVVVSMHQTVVKGPSQTSYLADPQSTVYSTEVLANTLVTGRRPWAGTDEVRTVWFAIPHVESLLLSRARRAAAEAGTRTREGGPESLFAVETETYTIRCLCSMLASMRLGYSELTPIFEIEFGEACSLATYLEPVQIVLRFFSAVAGFHLGPAGLAISALHPSEVDAASASRQHAVFAVNYIWSGGRVEVNDLHPGYSFVHGVTDDSLAVLAVCLRAWVAREPAWRRATMLMLGAMGLVAEASGDRLLMASRWLEAIPGAAAIPILSDADIAAISLKASEAARALGHSDLTARIDGALRLIKSEPNRTRLSRLAATVTRTFGDEAFGTPPAPEAVVDALMLATTYRGQAAHSFVGGGADSIMPLLRATAALEALCYLLTLSELPMGVEGRRRAVQSRLVRTWHYARAGLATP